LERFKKQARASVVGKVLPSLSHAVCKPHFGLQNKPILQAT